MSGVGSRRVLLSRYSDSSSFRSLTATSSPEPGLTEIMAQSTNYTERLYVWEQWRTVVGRQIRPLYIRYVELKNKLAQLNGFNDLGDEWRSKYETDDFESDVLELYDQLQPLYLELHAYIRRKLYEVKHILDY